MVPEKPGVRNSSPLGDLPDGGKRLLELAVSACANAVIITDAAQPDSPAVYANPAAEHITGYPLEEILGRNPRFLQGPYSDLEEVAELRRAVAEGREFYGVVRNRRKDGSDFFNEMYVAPVRDGDGAVTHFVGIQNDVTERRALEEEMEHRASHDPLTGLPNRAMFVERLGQAVARKARSGRHVSALFMDLDNFKDVNDSLGHEAGNQLLVAVAKRLRGCLRNEDTLARFAGDEFVVLVEDEAGGSVAAQLAERLLECLDTPFSLAGERVFVSASVGVAPHGPSDPDRGEALLGRADAAMYEAKRLGKARYATYDPAIQARRRSRLRMVNDLRAALEREEFVLQYQPKVDLKTGAVDHVEALARWHQPRRGLLLPAEFIPLAEETGLIVPLGRWVLEEACAQVRCWQDLHPRTQPVVANVNLSAKQFRQPDLAAEVAEVLEKTGLDPACLELEITERVLMEDAPATGAVLEKLKALDIKVAVDDFGTGYSSLSYLKRFPVDTLKIDRSFVSGLGTDLEDEVLVSGVLGLAHALGLRVVAEGVETEQQVASLKKIGCDLAQGYYFFRPLSNVAATPVLAKGMLP